MKRLLSTTLLATLFFGTLFAAPKKPLNLEPIQIDPIEQKNEYIEVIADPRLEVIGIICRLAGYDGFNNYYQGEATYTTQIDSYFSKYKDEKAVLTAKSLKDRGIDTSAMISLAYHIKPDFSGTVIDFDPYPDTLLENWKKIKTNEIYRFITNVHDFVVKTNYQRLLILNRGDLLASVGYFYNDFKNNAIAEWAEDFFGMNVFDRNVVSVNRICPLFMAYDIVKDRDGKTTTYTTVYPGCYFSSMTETYFYNFLQEYVDANWDSVKDNFTDVLVAIVKKLNPDVKGNEKKAREAITKHTFMQFFGDFVFLEYLRSPIYLEAVKDKENVLTYDYLYAELEKIYSAEWFYQIPELMGEFVNNRDKYPSLKDYFPKIVDFVNAIPVQE